MESAAIGAGATAAGLADWLSSPITQMMVIPLIGCLLICLTPKQNISAIRGIALGSALLSALFAVLILTGVPDELRNTGLQVGAGEWYPLGQYEAFVPEAGMQFEQKFSWLSIKFGELSSFGVEYYVGIDGLSLPLVLLSVFILVCVVLWSWRRSERVKEFLALTLFMQVGILGSFVALDYVLLYLFWEWMLIPMFFLIAGWGRDPEKSRSAAIKFFVYTLFGSVFMLIGFIALQVFSMGGLIYSFSIPGLTAYSLTDGYQSTHVMVRMMIFIGLLLGFAVKTPMWPFHTWLPDAHSEAPTEMSVILAALMLKSGTYAYLRCLYPTFPDIAYHIGPVIAVCGVIAIVYGAGITLLQTDLKRMVAWSSISHMGFIILGISAMNPNATIGAMFHMVGHGVVIALLFFLVGWIEQRYGTRDIRELSGLMGKSPGIARLLTLAAFAGMGFPGLIAFWGELLVLSGTYANNPLWYTVMVHGPVRVAQFLGTIVRPGPEGFYNSAMWYSPDVLPGMSGARLLQICAVVAVIGVLTSAVYMLNMLLKVVYSRDADSREEAASAQAAPQAVPVADSARQLAFAGAPVSGGGSGQAPTSPGKRSAAGKGAAMLGRLRPSKLFGLEWHHALVLLPLAVAVVGFGLYPQPLIELCRDWALVLSETQLRF